MSTPNRTTPVKWIRIQWPDKDKPITYNDEPSITMGSDQRTKIMYLRIAANSEAILVEPLSKFQWLEKSSSDGIAAISSSTNKIIIAYEFNNKTSRDFFIELANILENGAPPPSPPESPEPSPPPPRRKPSPPPPRRKSSPPPPRRKPNPQDQNETVINDLIRLINTGSSDDVGEAVQHLARARANVQFKLISKNDNQEKPRPTKPPSDTLQLTLIVECHLNKEPLRSTIYVHAGTDLLTLKTQITSETGIKREDQYWYAFGRYLIADDYEIGSTVSVVPLRGKNAFKNQAITPTDPIKSGDTLILYIAQIPPCK